MREKKEVDFSYQGSSEVWVADFGSEGLAENLDEEVNKLNVKKTKSVSWVFLSITVFLLIVVIEFLLGRYIASLAWSSMALLMSTWIWRIGLIVFWLYIARNKLRLGYPTIVLVSFLSFVSAAVFAALRKIFSEGSLWTWLNLLVEPIWMLLLVLVCLAVFIKIKKKIK